MAQIKVTQGTDFSINIICERYTDEQTTEPFDISVCQNVAINLLCEAHDEYISINDWELAEATTNVIQFTIRGDSLHAGAKYGLVITGRDGDGRKFKTRLRGKDFLYVVNSVSDLTTNEFITQPLNIILPMNFMGELQPIIFKDLATIAYVDEQIQDVEAYVDAAIAALPEVTIETDQTNGTKILHVGNKTMTISTDRPSESSQSVDAPTWAGMDAAIRAAAPDLTIYETKADHNTDMTNVNNAIAEVGTQAGNQYAELTQSINAEARTRSTNDQALQAAITTVDDKLEMYYPKTDVYNKTEIDNEVSTINGSIGSEESSRIAADDNLQTQINTKANTADVYNRTSVNSLLDDKADKATTYTKTEVDGLLDDKADSDDVYDKTEVYTKTETYTKTEVDELIEEAGGTSYTDKIVVGTNLIDNSDLGQPTAIFGQFNNGNQGYLSVGSGQILQYQGSVDIIDDYTPKDEYHTTYTKTINYPNFLDLLSTKGFVFSIYYGKIKNDSNTEVYIGTGNWESYAKGYKFTITFDENYQFRTKCVWNKTNEYTEFNILIKYDINTSDLTMTVTSSREVSLSSYGHNLDLKGKNIDKRDALVVKTDGKTYINETGNSTNLYSIQDKFSNIETNVNTINDAVSTIPNIEIISETDYDNYLFHDPNKTYMISEDEDLTPYKNEYFTIEFESSDQLSITSIQNYGTFEYSTDKTTWNTLSSTTSFWYGHKIYFRGTINQGATTTTCPFKIQDYYSHRSIKLSGNIMSLVYGANFQNQTSLADYPNIFSGFFNTIKFAIDASKLILPATTLSNNCYSGMFNGCTKLYYGPKELPATTLATKCYYQMFKGCTNLINPVSILPATSIENKNSYYEMYRNCTSITKTPSIRLTSGSLNDTNMFTDCTKLKYIEIMLVLSTYHIGLSYVFPSTNSSITNPSYFVLNENCTFTDNYNMPTGWTKVYITPPTNS